MKKAAAQYAARALRLAASLFLVTIPLLCPLLNCDF